MEMLSGDFVMTSMQYLSTMFVSAIGLAVFVVIILFILDITQTKDAVRKNYPVVGRFRYLFATLGEFFRQYFFAMDREEMPFNRAEREWIHKAAHGHSKKHFDSHYNQELESFFEYIKDTFTKSTFCKQLFKFFYFYFCHNIVSLNC